MHHLTSLKATRPLHLSGGVNTPARLQPNKPIINQFPVIVQLSNKHLTLGLLA